MLSQILKSNIMMINLKLQHCLLFLWIISTHLFFIIDLFKRELEYLLIKPEVCFVL